MLREHIQQPQSRSPGGGRQTLSHLAGASVPDTRQAGSRQTLTLFTHPTLRLQQAGPDSTASWYIPEGTGGTDLQAAGHQPRVTTAHQAIAYTSHRLRRQSSPIGADALPERRQGGERPKAEARSSMQPMQQAFTFWPACMGAHTQTLTPASVPARRIS